MSPRSPQVQQDVMDYMAQRLENWSYFTPTQRILMRQRLNNLPSNPFMMPWPTIFGVQYGLPNNTGVEHLSSDGPPSPSPIVPTHPIMDHRGDTDSDDGSASANYSDRDTSPDSPRQVVINLDPPTKQVTTGVAVLEINDVYPTEMDGLSYNNVDTDAMEGVITNGGVISIDDKMEDVVSTPTITVNVPVLNTNIPAQSVDKTMQLDNPGNVEVDDLPDYVSSPDPTPYQNPDDFLDGFELPHTDGQVLNNGFNLSFGDSQNNNAGQHDDDDDQSDISSIADIDQTVPIALTSTAQTETAVVGGVRPGDNANAPVSLDSDSDDDA